MIYSERSLFEEDDEYDTLTFNEHSSLKGKHAFLSASKNAWLNYDEDKLKKTYESAKAAALGVRLHAFAAEAISLGIKLPRRRDTLNAYVNDALYYRMIPEQVLFYSFNAFGTADAVMFYKGTLRIHDLKTGETPSSMVQLEVYAAFFCLEYGFDPNRLRHVELRIYQNNAVKVLVPRAKRIQEIMDTIIRDDAIIEGLEPVKRR